MTATAIGQNINVRKEKFHGYKVQQVDRMRRNSRYIRNDSKQKAVRKHE